MLPHAASLMESKSPDVNNPFRTASISEAREGKKQCDAWKGTLGLPCAARAALVGATRRAK